MIKVRDVTDGREYTAIVDYLHGMFYIIDEWGETVDEGNCYAVSDDVYYGVESAYARK